MSTVTLVKKELRAVVKESVHEAVAQELAAFRALLIPYVSKSEQKDIERLYGKPVRSVGKTVRVEI